MPPITPVNNAPTGTITISGVPAPDLTLYATNTIADLDGLGPISYQWFADNVAIVGATASAFTLTLDQVGKTLTVQAMYTDLLGNLETVISDPTGTVVLKGTITPGQGGGFKYLGTEFHDTINASSDNDTIYGLGGNDTIDGQAGSDLIDGGDGNDTIEGNYGNDTIYGGLGNDVITDFQGSNSVEGGAGDDTFTITSLVGQETLLGGLGNDTLNATGLLANLDGGEDNDNLFANAQLNFGGGTYYVQEGVANLQGGLGDDSLTETYYTRATLNGGEGNDYLNAAAGGDYYTNHGTQLMTVTLLGGAGNDRLNTSNYSSSYLDGGDGNDTFNAVGIDDSSNGWDIFSNHTLNPLTSTLVGGAGDDSLNAAWLSSASLDGGDGADNLYVRNVTTATLTGGAGTDNLTVSTSGSVYYDWYGWELPSSYNTDGNAYASKSYLLEGGTGNDNLSVSVNQGGYGQTTATLLGGEGNDTLNYNGNGQSTVTLDGGTGNDTINGSVDNHISWGQSTITLSGGTGDDSLSLTDPNAGDVGTNGQNYGIAYATLDGGEGNDTLTASGVLQLTMTGGAGVNKFVLTAQQYRTESEGARTFTNSDYTTTIVNADPTVITDFKAGVTGDLLDFSELLKYSAFVFYDGVNPFDFDYLALVQSGPDTLLKFDSDGKAGTGSSLMTVARLLNVNAADLTDVNFNPNFSLHNFQYIFNVTPTLTSLSNPVATGLEDSPVTVSFATLMASGNAADVDGTVNAFVVKSVTTGSLLIGSSLASAKPWNAVSNNTVDANHQAYWTGSRDANGTLNAFTVEARDNDFLASATPIQAVIDLTAVNDAPVAVDDTATGTHENIAITISVADLLLNDTDVEGDVLSLVSVSQGHHGSVVLNNNGTITFTPSHGFSGSADFTYIISDGQLNSNSAKVSINVEAVNHCPGGDNKHREHLEDSELTIGKDDFGFTDADSNQLLAVKINSLPIAGVLKLDGTDVSVGQSIAVTDIVANKLVYSPVANANGAGYASFDFQVQDDGGTAFGGADICPTANTLTIDVTPVNDAPLGTNNTVSTLEDTALLLSPADFTFTDIESNSLLAVKISSLPSAGILKLDGVNVVAGQLISATDIAANKLAFTPDANANGLGYATFGFQVQDDGGVSNGGVDVDTVANTITIDVTPVNDAPLGIDATLTVNQDSALILSTADFAFTDIESNSLLAVKISSLPSAGTLRFDGVDVTAGQSISASDIALNKLTFTPASSANGLAYASFGFQVQDDGGVSNGGVDVDAVANTITIDVTAVNQAPTLTSFASSVVTGNEDTKITITLADLKAQGDEADADGTVDGFVIKQVSTGALAIGTSAGTATAWNALTNNTIDATHQAYWTPAVNANGTLNAFTAVALDNGGLESLTPVQATVAVTPVNDLPTGNVLITGTPTVGQTLTESNTLADVDGLGVISYQWLANGSVIAGATNTTYVLTATEVGKTISVKASYVDGAGTAESVTSLATSAVIGANTGSQIFYSTKGDDTFNGNTNNDTVSYIYATDEVRVSLAINGPQSTYGSGKDTLIGIEHLIGSNYKDTLTGNALNNSLAGGLGNDTINAGAGNDTLIGGAGTDNLTGGAGADIFWFDTAANATSNKDTITDFVSGTDKLQFSANVLTAAGVTGQLVGNDQRFWSSNKGVAHDADDRFIYNTATGALSYDSDGTGKAAAVVLEILGSTKHPVLVASDIVLV